MNTVIRRQVIGVLRKAAGSYTTEEPTKVPGIKGEGTDLTPMAAGEKKSPGPTTTTRATKSASGCNKSGGGMNIIRPGRGRGRVKTAFERLTAGMEMCSTLGEKAAFDIKGMLGNAGKPVAGAGTAATSPGQRPQTQFPDKATRRGASPRNQNSTPRPAARPAARPVARPAAAPRPRRMPNSPDLTPGTGLGTWNGSQPLPGPYYQKAGSFAEKLAMMKIGPASMTVPMTRQRSKDDAEAKLRQTL